MTHACHVRGLVIRDWSDGSPCLVGHHVATTHHPKHSLGRLEKVLAGPPVHGRCQGWHAGRCRFVRISMVCAALLTKSLSRYGNKFYEDLNEIPGRHRWVDYKDHDYNTVQLEPVWHSWLHHIRSAPPNKDPIVEASHKTWETVSITSWLASDCYSMDCLIPCSIAHRDRVNLFR